ncbi:Aste57867_10294 [Aphanomyces stellatus]|uniref:Aste57867_10294 protein n=1 Tax=Aphanomyces stellatus TaxID=120398 RepID=A0A485KPZ3_9STRA|nr:hypothetical protein As57867_010254 [Aphanomyces stellatus]VFT87168.1 Aste57867_10294 [Aphanomyces stellatus]
MNDPFARLTSAPAPRKRRHEDSDEEETDPYANLPSATKVPCVEKFPSLTDKAAHNDIESRPMPTAARSDGVNNAGEAKTKTPLDVDQTIEKLHGYMLVDKKFAKASQLFGALLEEQCTAPKPTEARMTLLMETLASVLTSKKERVHDPKARGDFAALVRLVDKHRDALLRASAFESDVIDNWVVDAVLHNDLFTDDTYVFAKAAKQIAAHITGRRDEAVEMENLGDVDALDAVLLPCLRTLMTRHGSSWAKTSVEMVMGLCTARRLSFREAAARTEVDAWTSQIHQRRVAPMGKQSAAAEMRKNIVAYNETQTGIKVGKSNHPLYNKE